MAFFFCPLTAQKTKISKKWKKSLEIDIIILHVPKIMIRWCTVPEIWCATDGGQTDKQKKWHIEAGAPSKNYFLFWAIFCPFTTLTAWKIKIFKKRKKDLETLFYTSVPKIMIICYTVPEIWHVTYVIVIFHFGLFFLPLNSAKN